MRYFKLRRESMLRRTVRRTRTVLLLLVLVLVLVLVLLRPKCVGGWVWSRAADEDRRLSCRR